MVYFEFKCRRCGAIEKNPWCSDELAPIHLIHAIHGTPSNQPQTPGMLSFHVCKDGGVGVSDLQGFMVESQPAESDNAVDPALHTTAPAVNA